MTQVNFDMEKDQKEVTSSSKLKPVTLSSTSADWWCCNLQATLLASFFWPSQRPGTVAVW